MAGIDARVGELQVVRAELARVVERDPAAACHDPTATSWWCETALAEGRSERDGVLVLRLPLPGQGAVGVRAGAGTAGGRFGRSVDVQVERL